MNSFLFVKDGKEIQCENLNEAVNDYNENIKIYKEGNFFKRYKADLTYRLRPNPSSSEMYPIFFEMAFDKNNKTWVYLSPSQIGRSVFINKIDDLLGTHKSCSKTDGLCLCKACELFGIISIQKDGKTHASRLRFSDAKAVDNTFRSAKNVTLKELSGPKTTSVEFYTRRPENAIEWTYDNKVTENVIETIEGKNYNVSKRALCDVELNGRKFYVHNPKLKKDDYFTNKKQSEIVLWSTESLWDSAA